MSRTWWRGASPMLHQAYEQHQRSLPRLPVPQLASTMEKFLAAAKPLQSPQEHQRTVLAVDKFVRHDGERLNKSLTEAAALLPHDTSYIESTWMERAYLRPRDPVVINSNPAFLLAPSSTSDPLWRAATLLSATAEWAVLLRMGKLPRAKTCMSAFPAVLGTARIPTASCDRLEHSPASSHVAVSIGGGWCEVAIIDAGGCALSATHILRELQSLPQAIGQAAGHASSLSEAASSATAAGARPLYSAPVGAFTTEGRDRAAATRGALLEASPLNASSMARIDSALLVLVLDGRHPGDAGTALHSTVCGGGSSRWYDKLQLIVFANGEAGLNFEHAPCDGAQVVAYVEAIGASAALAGGAPPPPTPEGTKAAAGRAAATARPLTWQLPPALLSTLTSAASEHEEVAASLDSATAVIQGPGWGGLSWARQHRVSLDALVQLAIQAGWFKLRRTHESVYEACSTAAFSHGRTEVIRSLTDASASLSEQMARREVDDDASTAAMLPLLDMALAKHREIVTDCQRGLGHERHMLALCGLSEAQALNGRAHPLFTADKGWPTVSSTIISTSGLRSAALAGFVFGPVATRGVGVGYLLTPSGFTMSVTSWGAAKGAPESGRLLEAIVHSARRLQRLVQRRSRSGGEARPMSRL
jgi:carnitine O-acetyltransferase